MFDERLTTPRSWWTLPVLLGLSLGFIFLVFGPVPAFIALVAGVALGAIALNSYGSARIRVTQGQLVTGQAHIPVQALGTAAPLAPDEARAWRGYKADSRAYMLLRSYVPTALKVEVTDEHDPTPYLYLSTRRPEQLASALDRAKSDA